MSCEDGEGGVLDQNLGQPSSNMGLENCSSSCSSGVTAPSTCLGVGQVARATPSIESVVLE